MFGQKRVYVPPQKKHNATRQDQSHTEPIKKELLYNAPQEVIDFINECKREGRTYYGIPFDNSILPYRKSEKVEKIPQSRISELLTEYGISASYATCIDGPALTSYLYNLTDPKCMTKLPKAAEYISMQLHTTATIEKSDLASFAVVISKSERNKLYLQNVMPYEGGCKEKIATIGITSNNQRLSLDITKLPHLLIAGATGSGKSVLLNTIITSLLLRNNVPDFRLVLLDPKRVELSAYKDIPQLLCPIATTPEACLNALLQTQGNMRYRYQEMERLGIKQIDDLYEEGEYIPPHTVVVIDELSELMLYKPKQTEEVIKSIAQLGRAAGIHLIVATQRPTVDVITGGIKANIPARIALTTASGMDSRTILDTMGAEKLTGRGDALYKAPDKVNLTRFQVAYTEQEDIDKICEYYRTEAIVTPDGRPYRPECYNIIREKENHGQSWSEAFVAVGTLMLANHLKPYIKRLFTIK